MGESGVRSLAGAPSWERHLPWGQGASSAQREVVYLEVVPVEQEQSPLVVHGKPRAKDAEAEAPEDHYPTGRAAWLAGRIRKREKTMLEPEMTA